MNRKNFNSRCLLLLALLAAGATQFSRAADIARISGSYELLQKQTLGSETRVRLHVRLTNHGERAFIIQRLILSDSSHSVRSGSQIGSIALRANSSVDTTQEFTLPRADYQLWKRGTRPRVILEALTPAGHRTIEVVRLAPTNPPANQRKAN